MVALPDGRTPRVRLSDAEARGVGSLADLERLAFRGTSTPHTPGRCLEIWDDEVQAYLTLVEDTFASEYLSLEAPVVFLRIRDLLLPEALPEVGLLVS